MVLTLALIGGPLPRLDERVRHAAVVHHPHWLTTIATHVFRLGEARTSAAVLCAGAAAYALIRRKRFELAGLALVTAALFGLAIALLKHVTGRSIAPEASHPTFGVGGTSYPSGHVGAAAICWGLAAYLLTRADRRTTKPAVTVAAVVTVAVAAAATYGPSHWLSDCVASMLLAGATIAGFHAATRRLSRRGRRQTQQTQQSPPVASLQAHDAQQSQASS